MRFHEIPTADEKKILKARPFDTVFATKKLSRVTWAQSHWQIVSLATSPPKEPIREAVRSEK